MRAAIKKWKRDRKVAEGVKNGKRLRALLIASINSPDEDSAAEIDQLQDRQRQIIAYLKSTA